MDLTLAEDTGSGWYNSVDFGSWSGFAQDMAKTYVNYDMQSKQNDAKIEQMKLQAYSNFGIPYIEGQANRAATLGGIPTVWLLIGGAVLAVVMLKN